MKKICFYFVMVLALAGMTSCTPKHDKTVANLKAAIDGETYEFTEMYPGFIKDAETEKVQGALVSFNFAQDAEKGHAKIYTDVLAQLSTPEAIVKEYFVCPKCGNTYSGIPSSVCELCQTSSEQFMSFKSAN